MRAWTLSATVHGVSLLMLLAVHRTDRAELPGLSGQRSVTSVQLVAVVGEPNPVETLPPTLEIPALEPDRHAVPDLTGLETATGIRRPAEPPPEVSADWVPPDVAEVVSPSAIASDPRRSESQPAVLAISNPRRVARRPSTSAVTGAAASVAVPDVLGLDWSHPSPLANEPPRYPAEAVRQGWEGTVMLRLRITAAGAVEDVAIATGSGFAILDEAAASAVKRWRFRPARKGDRPVKAIVLLPVLFELTARSPTPEVAIFSPRVANSSPSVAN